MAETLSSSDPLSGGSKPLPGSRAPVAPGWEPAQSRSTSDLLSGRLTDPRLPFLHLVEPLFQRARGSLLDGLEELAAGGDEPPFVPEGLTLGFTLHLARQLLEMLSRVMVLEMNVADHEGRLGEGSERERFERFGDSLRRPEVRRAILEEYPVLARQVEIRLGQWLETSLELARRLVEDLPVLRERFCAGEHPGPVTELTAGLGDRHRGGRSVTTLTFRCGLRLVYKPRPLALEAAFQELLAWCNRRLAEPFRLLVLLDRVHHGWVEHVAPAGCESRGEVARFFARQGRCLALLHALKATDFHFENLIAAGEQPVLVDLESLFHPRLESGEEDQAADPAAAALAASVLDVGLLPLRMFARSGTDGVDVSGLGAREGQLTPRAAPVWEKAGTTAMRLVRRRVPFTTGSHLPRLGKEPVEVLDYLEDLTRGFEEMYRLLLEHRRELAAAGGPLAAFEAAEVRAVLRPTRVYALLLQESFHPDLLREEEERARFFDRLHLDLVNRPWLEPLIPFEREALARGDVPLFTSRPVGRSLWTDGGRELPGFFDTAASALVREGLEGLDEGDLALQQRLIRASVATLYPEREGDAAFARLLPGPPPAADRAGLVGLAAAVGERLAVQTLERGEDVGWLGYLHHGSHAWSVTAAGLDLFDGLPGIALFLAHLGRSSGEARFTELAERTLATLRRRLAHRGETMTEVGAFQGWGGVIYLLAHLGALWGRPELLAEARAHAEGLPELIDRDTIFDIVAGSAGCIGALLALHRAEPHSPALDLAAQCGEHLLANTIEIATQSHGGALGWVGPIAPRPLTGFSHGAAGIAWALVELAAATGEDRFADAARRAMAYERSLFSPAAGNWPDTRGEPSEEGSASSFLTAWCYGAVGIGLGRLACWRHLRDGATRAEAEIAVTATLAQGFGKNHSLNQGDFGSLELLLEARRHLGDDATAFDLEALTRGVLADLAATGPRCATPLGAESAGLMIGLAGIGYGLLRQAAPEQVPSVLLLEGPAPIDSEIDSEPEPARARAAGSAT